MDADDSHDSSNDDEDTKGLGPLELISDDYDEDGGSDIDDDHNDGDKDKESDDMDPLDELNEEDRKKLFEDTMAVRTTLNKVRI